MLVSRAPRHPLLVPFVERLWWSQADVVHEVETILPTGRGQLIVDLRAAVGGAVVQGPRATATEIDPNVQRRAIGVAFRSGGTAAFVDAPASELSDRFVALDDLWSTAAALVDDLAASGGPGDAFDRLERELLRHLDHSPDAALDAAEVALARGRPVDEVAAAVSVDRRHLATRFAERYGFGPKRYGRLRRFERALRAIRAGGADPLARVAADLGYADQAHLSREVREFSGVTPGELRRTPTGAPTHLRRTGDSFKTASPSSPTLGG